MLSKSERWPLPRQPAVFSGGFGEFTAKQETHGHHKETIDPLDSTSLKAKVLTSPTSPRPANTTTMATQKTPRGVAVVGLPNSSTTTSQAIMVFRMIMEQKMKDTELQK